MFGSILQYFTNQKQYTRAKSETGCKERLRLASEEFQILIQKGTRIDISSVLLYISGMPLLAKN